MLQPGGIRIVSVTPRRGYNTVKLRDLPGVLQQPDILLHTRRFLYRLEQPDGDVDNTGVEELPYLWKGRQVSVFHNASATFYAPSEHAGPNGMHREMIRCTPSWFGGGGRYDTVLVSTGDHAVGIDGMTVARVRAFISFIHDGVLHRCALVEWFIVDDEAPDEVTGMWVVRPEVDAEGERVMDIIAIETVVRACHLIGVYGTTFIPPDFDFVDSLDAFERYYVNWYADYHAHEIIV